MQSDGFSLDDKRQPLLEADQLGVNPAKPLSVGEHAKNNLPDILARWENRDKSERKQPRTAQSFNVPKAEIAASGSYDLSLNRYKEVEHDERQHASPTAILQELRTLEDEISNRLVRLEEILG